MDMRRLLRVQVNHRHDAPIASDMRLFPGARAESAGGKSSCQESDNGASRASRLRPRPGLTALGEDAGVPSRLIGARPHHCSCLGLFEWTGIHMHPRVS